jgi:hypothetical protein
MIKLFISIKFTDHEAKRLESEFTVFELLTVDANDGLLFLESKFTPIASNVD